MERYAEPQIFAAAVIRPFVVSPINQRAFIGTDYDFTGFFENRKFIEMERFITGQINGVKFVVVERPDQCELILKEDGDLIRPKFHQLAIGIDCQLATEPCADFVNAVMEALAYRRMSNDKNESTIEKVKIFNFNPFGVGKEKPKLSKLSFFEMEELNRSISGDGLSKLSIVLNEKPAFGLDRLNLAPKEIVLTGRKLDAEFSRIKQLRVMRNGDVPVCSYKKTDFMRISDEIDFSAEINSAALGACSSSLKKKMDNRKKKKD